MAENLIERYLTDVREISVTGTNAPEGHRLVIVQLIFDLFLLR